MASLVRTAMLVPGGMVLTWATATVVKANIPSILFIAFTPRAVSALLPVSRRPAHRVTNRTKLLMWWDFGIHDNGLYAALRFWADGVRRHHGTRATTRRQV